MSRRDVLVIILHARAGPSAGALTQALATARERLADEHRRGFLAAGATGAAVVAGPPDGQAFGARLRGIAAGLGDAGLVIMGSGAIPLATVADRRAFLEVAGGPTPQALANNRYSADIIAIARASEALAEVPDDLATDNALPRWLDEHAGIPVADLRRRWRLAIDLDGPLDLALLGGPWRVTLPSAATDRVDDRLARLGGVAADRAAELLIAGRTSAGTLRWLDEDAGIPVADLRRRWRLAIDLDGPLDLALLGGRWRAMLPPASTDRVDDRLARLRAVAADLAAELLIAGRASAGTLRWLEGHSAARVRALIEERGLRTSRPGQRPPGSVLGLLLDRDGPASLGRLMARLADGAIVDTRVLLAHQLGPDEAAWPPAEDRFASDLLLHEQIADPWLRELTQAAAEAPIPVLLGGHTLVGPGVRLALRRAR